MVNDDKRRMPKIADISSPHEVKTLLTWKAPGRPYRKRSRQFYLLCLLIVVPIEIILFLFGQYMLMLVVISFLFLVVTLVTTPPHDFTYKISTEGVMVEDHFFLWRELYDFYFKTLSGMPTVFVRTHTIIPGAVILTLGEMERDKVKAVLLPYLPYREVVKPSFMEKAGDWLARTFPLEKLDATSSPS